MEVARVGQGNEILKLAHITSLDGSLRVTHFFGESVLLRYLSQTLVVLIHFIEYDHGPLNPASALSENGQTVHAAQQGLGSALHQSRVDGWTHAAQHLIHQRYHTFRYRCYRDELLVVGGRHGSHYYPLTH